MKPDAVLDLALTEVAQPRRPLPGMDQIIRHVLGEKDVPGIAAIHHPLRHVDARPGEVGAPAHVGHLAHRSAVNAHAHRKFRVLLERLGNLERAPGRFLRAVAKDQRHPITGRQPNELFVGRFAHRRRRQHDLSELVQPLLLLLDQELRVTDDVDEKTCPISRSEIVGPAHGLGGGFRHDPDLLREGDEARVVLVGAQERDRSATRSHPVVRGPGVLQPLNILSGSLRRA